MWKIFWLFKNHICRNTVAEFSVTDLRKNVTYHTTWVIMNTILMGKSSFLTCLDHPLILWTRQIFHNPRHGMVYLQSKHHNGKYNQVDCPGQNTIRQRRRMKSLRLSELSLKVFRATNENIRYSLF